MLVFKSKERLLKKKGKLHSFIMSDVSDPFHTYQRPHLLPLGTVLSKWQACESGLTFKLHWAKRHNSPTEFLNTYEKKNKLNKIISFNPINEIKMVVESLWENRMKSF